MESKIGWIDFSPSQKARVKRFMDMIDAGGMLDELGVGVIRDSISNEIFPGFSTLYTRAKYFFITPYILLDWYRKNHEQDGVEYFNKVERKVNEIISQYFEKSQNNDESYFGKRTGGKLSRQPSEVYWNGIKRLKLVDTERLKLVDSAGSLEQMLNHKPYANDELRSNDKGNGIVTELGELGESSIVHVTPFPGWKDFINEHGLTLQEGEAETLKQHLLDNVPDSLPALLVSDSGIWEKYKEVKGKRIESGVLNNPMICFIKQVHSKITNQRLKNNLVQAHNFSLFMYGPHIAYNISLRNKFGGNVIELREKGRLWFKSLNDRMIGDFNIIKCPGWGKLKPFTREYLGKVQKKIISADSWDAIEECMCKLAQQQEIDNKRKKTRFRDGNNIDQSKEYGLGLINYRYHAVLSVVDDIYNHIASK